MRPIPWLFLLLAGCGAVEHGSRLSDRPEPGPGVYLSTGGSPRPFRTLGFAQVTGVGVALAGVVDVGDAVLDGAIRGTMSEVARQMGGDGVIHIEFTDLNPQTPAERASALVNSMRSRSVSTQNRSLLVTGEIIQFVQP